MAPRAKNAENPRYGGWYNDDVSEVPADFRHLLEQYSQIPSGVVVAHVNQIVSAFRVVATTGLTVLPRRYSVPRPLTTLRTRASGSSNSPC